MNEWMNGYKGQQDFQELGGTKSELINVDAHVIDKIVKLWTVRVV